ncbi:MAG: class I SAM-dependent methyltransferase [Acidobacteriota bacterium]
MVRCHERVAIAALLIFLVACTSASGVDEAEQIAEVLGLEPGMRVADVGAGDGEWSEELALRVGASGHVYATEVDEDDLEDIRQRFGDAGLENVTSILGDAEDTGLPEDCCDAILLRLVYHHFTDPVPMRASLRQALRQGGVIAVIDIEPQEDWRELPGVPDRGGHGIRPADLVEEMTADGFDLVARFDEWGSEDDHYCVVFQRADKTVSGVEPEVAGAYQGR